MVERQHSSQQGTERVDNGPTRKSTHLLTLAEGTKAAHSATGAEGVRHEARTSVEDDPRHVRPSSNDRQPRPRSKFILSVDASCPWEQPSQYGSAV